MIISFFYLPTEAIAMSFGGNTSIPILLDDLKCDGTESSLLQCHREILERLDCTHEEDAGAKCTGWLYRS